MPNEELKPFGIAKSNVLRSDIPAVTLIDYSARIRMVHEDTRPRYFALINSFTGKGGAVIVNTSFNVCGEPIAGSPEDAFRCFMDTEIEAMAVGTAS